jgi:FXSXX-COOH protein
VWSGPCGIPSEPEIHGADTVATDEGAVPAEARTGGDAGPAFDGGTVESPVLDLASLTPDGVAALPDTVLGALLRRIHDSCADGDPFVTGHKESQ